MYYQNWLIEKRLVYVCFGGEVSVEDIAIAYKESSNFVASSDQTVHILHNWEDVTQFPTQLNELVSATRPHRSGHRNLGWVVAYGNDNYLMKFLGNLFFQMARVKFRMFKHKNEAIAFLQHMDDNLPSVNVLIPDTALINDMAG